MRPRTSQLMSHADTASPCWFSAHPSRETDALEEDDETEHRPRRSAKQTSSLLWNTLISVAVHEQSPLSIDT